MHFDFTLRVQDVVSILMLLGGVLVWWKTVSVKLAVHDTKINTLQRWCEAHEECAKEHEKMFAEIREALAYLKGKTEV